MLVVPVTRSRVCAACRWNLLSARSLQHGLRHQPEHCCRFSISTSPNDTFQQTAHSQFQDDSKPQEEKHRKRKWKASLERKRLGEDVSVLIVRDAERGRQRRKVEKKEPQAEQEDTSSSSLGNILSMLKTSDYGPEQKQEDEAALQSISALRPPATSLTADRPQIVSFARFGSLLKSLSTAFSQNQLARYLTTHGIAAIKAETSAKRKSKSSKLTTVSLWVPKQKLKVGKTKGDHKGRQALANNIIRSLWNLEIKEEIEDLGSLEVKTDPARMSIMIKDEKAGALAELSKVKSVQIAIIQERGAFVVTGNKYDCLEVADNIERLLVDLFTVELNFRSVRELLSKEPSEEADAKLYEVAKRCSCTLNITGSGNVIKIQGTKDDTDRCQRGIVGLFPNLVRSTIRTIVDNASEHKEGSLCLWPSGSRSLPFAYRNLRLGRLSRTSILRSPSRKFDEQINGDALRKEIIRKPLAFVSDKDKNKITSELLQSGWRKVHEGKLSGTTTTDESSHVSWSATPQLHMTATPGHILHSMKESETVRQAIIADLMGPQHLPFTPSVRGLPQFMVGKAQDMQRLGETALKIRLIPSPWQFNTVAAQQAFPPLEMTVSLGRREESMELQSLDAILNHRIVNVMLPTYEADVRFASKLTVSCGAPHALPAVRDFVEEIASTARGYGVIRMPSTIQMEMPTWMRRLSKDARNKPEASTPVQYFAAQLDYETSLVFPFREYYLSIQQTGGGEFGVTSESIQLCSRANFSGDSSQSAEGGNPLPDENAVQDFVLTTSRLLKELYVSTGNLRMLQTHPETADARIPDYRKPNRTWRLQVDRAGAVSTSKG